MPSFLHPERRYVLTTSYKVMYSTLLQQPALRPCAHDLTAALRAWMPGVHRYLLVRDPYARTLSFFADKLRHANAREGRWQACQRVFFPLARLSGRESEEVITRTLRAIEFGAFVQALPALHRRDPHLWPQAWSRRFRIGPLALPAPLHGAFRIEQPDVLRRELGLDPTIRANAQEHETPERVFTPAEYAVVNEVYRIDFELFGYPMRSADAGTTQAPRPTVESRA